MNYSSFIWFTWFSIFFLSKWCSHIISMPILILLKMCLHILTVQISDSDPLGFSMRGVMLCFFNALSQPLRNTNQDLNGYTHFLRSYFLRLKFSLGVSVSYKQLLNSWSSKMADNSSGQCSRWKPQCELWQSDRPTTTRSKHEIRREFWSSPLRTREAAAWTIGGETAGTDQRAGICFRMCQVEDSQGRTRSCLVERHYQSHVSACPKKFSLFEISNCYLYAYEKSSFIFFCVMFLFASLQ